MNLKCTGYNVPESQAIDMVINQSTVSITVSVPCYSFQQNELEQVKQALYEAVVDCGGQCRVGYDDLRSCIFVLKYEITIPGKFFSQFRDRYDAINKSFGSGILSCVWMLETTPIPYLPSGAIKNVEPPKIKSFPEPELIHRRRRKLEMDE